jgi:4-amino-4-deoxy-L-arabinose transferase-like glycosyltransferase
MHNTGDIRPVIIKGLLISVLLFITALLYGRLVTVNIMEARNFITAREMVREGNWLLPTLNGEPRIAKPPLPSWVTALFMLQAGTDADLMVNRIPSGISALLMAFFACMLVKSITGDEEITLLFLLVLATSFMFMLSARKNAWDIYSISFMTGAVWALAEVFNRSRGRVLFLALAAFFMTCAFYSKGPVPFWVMLVPFLTAYAIVFGTQALRTNKWGMLWAFLCCIVLSAAWPLYVYLNLPHTAAAVASGESQGWFTRHTQPVWYYLLHLQDIVGIWIFYLIYGLVAPFIKKDWAPREKFFVVWFILTLVAISIFPEKKARYLLPAVVPGAMISAVAVRRLCENPGVAGKIVNGAFCLTTVLVFLVAAGGLVYFSRGGINLPLLAGIPLLLLACGLLAGAYVKKQFRRIPFIAVSGLCLCLVFLPPAVSVQFGHDQTDPFMHLRDDPAYKAADFYSLGRIPPEVIWASGRIIRPLGDQSPQSLMEKGKPFILLSEGAMDEPPARFHLLETAQTDKRTFYIYRFNPDIS